MKEMVNLRIDQKQKEKLKSACKSLDIDISEYLRKMIDKSFSESKNISFLRENLVNLRVDAERIHLEAEQLIQKEKETYEEKITQLDNQLKIVTKEKEESLKTIKKIEMEIKEHIDFTEFIDKLNESDSFGEFWKDMIALLPTKEKMGIKVPVIDGNKMRAYYDAKKNG